MQLSHFTVRNPSGSVSRRYDSRRLMELCRTPVPPFLNTNTANVSKAGDCGVYFKLFLCTESKRMEYLQKRSEGFLAPSREKWVEYSVQYENKIYSDDVTREATKGRTKNMRSQEARFYRRNAKELQDKNLFFTKRKKKGEKPS